MTNKILYIYVHVHHANKETQVQRERDLHGQIQHDVHTFEIISRSRNFEADTDNCK